MGLSDQGKFGLDVAILVLEYYNVYYDIAYPLPKLDLIAIPDFACGAMVRRSPSSTSIANTPTGELGSDCIPRSKQELHVCTH